MTKLFALILSVLIANALTGQTITGLVKDEQGKTLSGASVALKRIKDSSVVKLAVSNQAGKYEFLTIAAGTYFINVSYVGHSPKNSVSFEVSGE